MKELSYNKASTFRSCPKKFYWRYIEKLYPVLKVSALSLGSIIHEAFDKFYKGTDDQETYKFISLRFDEEIAKEEIADQEDLILNKYIALGMWWNYPFKNVKYDHMASEEEFNVDLCNGWQFVGKVDGRVQQYGKWWVRELKTTSLSDRQFASRCQTSAQGTGYVFGLSKDYDIKGILYEYIRKPILRKGIKETVEMFGRRIQKDYRERQKFYFNQLLSYRTPVDITQFKYDTCMLVRAIQNALDTGEYYRNMDSCWTFGSECPYLKICMEEVPDQLTLDLYFTRKEVVEDER